MTHVGCWIRVSFWCHSAQVLQNITKNHLVFFHEVRCHYLSARHFHFVMFVDPFHRFQGAKLSKSSSAPDMMSKTWHPTSMSSWAPWSDPTFFATVFGQQKQVKLIGLNLFNTFCLLFAFQDCMRFCLFFIYHLSLSLSLPLHTLADVSCIKYRSVQLCSCSRVRGQVNMFSAF